MNKNLKILIKKHEKVSFFPYRCSERCLTIGWGRNLSDNGISKEEAEYLLDNDIDIAVREVKKIFPALFTYTEQRTNALIDMYFNLGFSNFISFKKMIKAVREKNWDKAAAEAKDSLWYKQVEIRGVEIVEMLKRG